MNYFNTKFSRIGEVDPCRTKLISIHFLKLPKLKPCLVQQEAWHSHELIILMLTKVRDSLALR